MISFFPAMMPACGPPRSLSPLNITTETPASMLCLTGGFADAVLRKINKAARPRSSRAAGAALAEGHELFSEGLS